MSNSRFRQSQTIFTTDKQAAFDSMASEAERPLALETIKNGLRDKSLRSDTIFKPTKIDEKVGQQITPAPLDWAPTTTKSTMRL